MINWFVNNDFRFPGAAEGSGSGQNQGGSSGGNFADDPDDDLYSWKHSCLCETICEWVNNSKEELKFNKLYKKKLKHMYNNTHCSNLTYFTVIFMPLKIDLILRCPLNMLQAFHLVINSWNWTFLLFWQTLWPTCLL